MTNAAQIVAGKVVVVTGGFGVLGAAVAQAAKAAGARVAVIGHGDPYPGLDVDYVQSGVDLADLAQAQAAFARIAGDLGPIDALVNAAGGFVWRKFDGDDLDVWGQMFRINLQTAACACRAVLPQLAPSGGAIVNIAAASADRAAAGMGAYAASKAGVLRLTESLAEELKGRGVRVNAISPTIIDTPQNRRDMPKADPAAWASPQEVAEAVMFLISDAASGVTGANLRVAGRS